MDQLKFQAGEPPAPQGVQEDVIISPDTLRENRIPPRQARTRKWPVLDAFGPPQIDLNKWKLQVKGLVKRPVHDWGWTTNMPLGAFFAEDALFADTHDGAPIPLEHGGPLRLVVPRLYAWKSAKWVSGVEFLANDQAGYWENGGYHMNGDPWREERYR
jgi:DMSO/TMAO reductase YedYZ molybdopterin-dependent catalytic subunit